MPGTQIFSLSHAHDMLITFFISSLSLKFTTHFQVGTVDPVGDFRAIISRRDEDKFDEGECPVKTEDVFKTL